LTKRSWTEPEPNWRPLRRMLRYLDPPIRVQLIQQNLDAYKGPSDLASDLLNHKRRTDLLNHRRREFEIGERQRELRRLTRIKNAFDNSISKRQIVVFARCPVSKPFKQLPPDVWISLKVTDWRKGVAVAPDGTVYSSIHFGGVNTGAISQSPPLKKASEAVTAKEIASLYDEIEQIGKDNIPDVNVTADMVHLRLAARGISASKRQIIKLAKSFASRRRPRGRPLSKPTYKI
jgi:hypothetical protein